MPPGKPGQQLARITKQRLSNAIKLRDKAAQGLAVAEAKAQGKPVDDPTHMQVAVNRKHLADCEAVVADFNRRLKNLP